MSIPTLEAALLYIHWFNIAVSKAEYLTKDLLKIITSLQLNGIQNIFSVDHMVNTYCFICYIIGFLSMVQWLGS